MDVAFDEASEGRIDTGKPSPHPLKLMRRLQALEEHSASLGTEWKDIQTRRSELLPEVCP